MHEHTHVGLDVHALTVVACAIDGETGEILRARLTPDHGEILAWIQGLPGPSRVVYEAGPTGFVLARVLRDAGVDCLVAAPSKLQRPSGDRVKTDRNDALHLARLLKLDQITQVIVPDPGLEAARDLVRASEDTRGDLMRARHRVSKLLLRQGIHYNGGGTWTRDHMSWLYRQRFDSPALQLAYDLAVEAVVETWTWTGVIALTRPSPRSSTEANTLPSSGRWNACVESPRSQPSAWPWRSETGTGSPAAPSVRTSVLSPAKIPPANTAPKAASPRPETPTPDGC
jgi:hypothetical protein